MFSSIKRKINHWKWNIAWWLQNSHIIYINSLNIRKMYWPWYEVKDLFNRPRWRWQKWYDTKWCIFKMTIRDLGWKTKFSDYRHEENPYIIIEFLKWSWRGMLMPPGKDKDGNECDMQYYETMLTYLYDERFKNNFKQAFEYCNSWTKIETPKEYLTCKSCLTEKALKLLE